MVRFVHLLPSRAVLTIDSRVFFFLPAQDYVEGMWRMLQQDEPEDFVLATGETHPVREFVEKAFAVVDIKLKSVFYFLIQVAIDAVWS